MNLVVLSGILLRGYFRYLNLAIIYPVSVVLSNNLKTVSLRTSNKLSLLGWAEPNSVCSVI